MVSHRLPAKERRLSILRAAIPLFAAQGFNGTTTKQIAVAAKVSEALLYKHFPSKEAIYEGLDEIAVRKQQVSEHIASLTPSTENLVRIVYFVIRTIYEGDPKRREQPIDHAHMHRLMANSYLEDGAFARQFLEQILQSWAGIFERCIDFAIGAGDMIGDWIRPQARWWLAHHLGYALGFLNMPEKQVIPYGFPRAELPDQAVRFALRGMGLTDEAIARYYDLETLEAFRCALFDAMEGRAEETRIKRTENTRAKNRKNLQ